MPHAREAYDLVPCDPYTLPDGTTVVELPYDGTALHYHQMPGGLRLSDGTVLGKSSRNSDTGRVTYRSDKTVAFNL